MNQTAHCLRVWVSEPDAVATGSTHDVWSQLIPSLPIRVLTPRRVMEQITNEIIHKSHILSRPMSDTINQTNQNYSCAIGFPHRNGDVVLRDGSTVRIRAMQPSDEQA